MPKKFVGENSKAVAAKARKDGAKQAEAEKKKQATEDAYWAEDDKNVLKKQARKEEEERKKLEAQRRKEENKKAAEEELKQLQGKSTGAPAKVTQAAILAQKEEARKRKEAQEQAEKLAASKIIAESDDVHENVNVTNEGHYSARNVDEALAVMDALEPEVDQHPEKRMKAAYEAYSEVNLPRLKKENPTLRLSQLKQLLKKEWMKAPENPLNIKMAALSMQ